MRIVLAGGGTGGHLYPLIAVAEQIKKEWASQKILDTKMYLLSPTDVDPALLLEHNIQFKKIIAGKIRIYPSLQNVIDSIKMPFALIQAFFVLFSIYPDVVFSKGGYGAFPIVCMARLLFIPVVIHESDTVPGRVNLWSGKFAKKIAVSYPEAAHYFPLEKVAHTGQPIREALLKAPAAETENTDLDTKTILILGGSQGAMFINEVVAEALPLLVSEYQVLHQAGADNLADIQTLTDYLLLDNPHKDRYTPMGFIDAETLNKLGNQSDIIITRAGSTLFEIAQWEKPAIIVPITESNGNHQRKNAFAYTRPGAGVVIEERNFSAHILRSQIEKIMKDTALYASMKQAAKSFQRPSAAADIAKEIIHIAASH